MQHGHAANLTVIAAIISRLKNHCCITESRLHLKIIIIINKQIFRGMKCACIELVSLAQKRAPLVYDCMRLETKSTIRSFTVLPYIS